MKRKITFSILLMLAPLFSSSVLAQCTDLIITAVFDGPLDSAPRGIELYAKKDISDLSIFSIGSANNGLGSNGEEFTLPIRSINAGTFLYISKDSLGFHDFFGFAPDNDLIPLGNPAVGFLNGDDAIELFCNGVVTDIFGVVNHTQTGLDWNYENGWAYRLSGTGVDGMTFKRANWTIDRNALVNATTNLAATASIPLGTYDTFPACDRLIITGIYDGPLPGGEPQGIELFVTRDIPDLSLFGFGSVTNGNGSSGVEVDFPSKSIEANTFLYLTSDSASFHDFFGFAPTMETPSANINGNDAVELFCKQGEPRVIDVFGDINTDGLGTAWEYTDGWAYRKDATGADDSTFLVNNWTFGGLNALEGGMINNQVTIPFPVSTYQFTTANSCLENEQLPEGNLTNGIYRVANALIATSTIPTNGNVTFQAGQVITLQAGFHAYAGSEFLAEITDCSSDFRETTIEAKFVQEESLEHNKKNTTLATPVAFDFTVYPNPTKTQLTADLLLQETTTVQIQLLDITGRVVKILTSRQALDKGRHQLWFDLSGLNTGMYWLQVSNEKQTLTERIAIIK